MAQNSNIINLGLGFLAYFVLSTAALGDGREVSVDIGHTLREPGAISAHGVDEHSFNRRLGGLLAQRLRQQGLAVREVNFAGDVASLAERPQQAAGSDFFISIHHDSISEAWLLPWEWQGQQLTHTEVKRGFGIFVSAKNPQVERSLRCASAIGARMRTAGFTPSDWHGRKHRPADAENGVWYYDNLVVLYRTTLPAVLFEAGVIKHRDEELELQDSERQWRMAGVVAAALDECVPATEKRAPA